MRAFHIPVPGGDGGTYATLGIMARAARAAAVTPIVRRTAVALASSAATRDGTVQAAAIRGWLDDHIVFLRDPTNQELVHDPVVLVRSILAKGVVHVDCDDVATLAAALGLSVGLRARFVIVGFKGMAGAYRHVWTELSDPRRERWIEMDITRPAQGLGGLPITRIFRREV
jgi:transglutaminase-like putative cysteine protease